jgi:signal transduction histidine kinase
MYLRTQLLLGIAIITLIALGLSVLVPLGSIRGDVSRETEASMQLARLLLDVEHDVAAADAEQQARIAAAEAVRHTEPLRHVKISLVDTAGRTVAVSPTDERRGESLSRALLPSSSGAALSYPISYRGVPLGMLRVAPNPLSETAEIEQRVERDLALLVLAILAMAAAIYSMVRRGLSPVGQIQAALARLESGDLEARLPHFKLKDLDEISERFNRCAAAMQEAASQRREMTRRLIDVEEEERKRLARELHDELGQSLTAVKVDAAYIAREAAGSDPRIEACARGIEQLTTEIMEMIRGMLARLRPHGLETVGLRDTLKELVDGWQARLAGRFSCTLALSGPINSLSPDLNITLYRLIQECLTNAVRHSRARSVSIQVQVDEADARRTPRVAVRVREFDVAPEAGQVCTSGTGLLGMRERVAAHGGQLEIELSDSGGMSLTAWMPALARRKDSVDA